MIKIVRALYDRGPTGVVSLDKYDSMISKERLKEQIEALPDPIDIERLIDRLRFIEMIERRVASANEATDKKQDEVREEINEWLK